MLAVLDGWHMPFSAEEIGVEILDPFIERHSTPSDYPWISDSDAAVHIRKSSSPRNLSLVSWRFWLIMMTGAWTAASIDRNRLSRM